MGGMMVPSSSTNASIQRSGSVALSTAGGVVGTRTGADEMTFDASSLSTNNGCARVDLDYSNQMNLKVGITLPCLASNDGDSCKVSRSFVARSSTCGTSIYVESGSNAYWLVATVSSSSFREGLEPVELTVIDGDTQCDEGVSRCDAVIDGVSWNHFYFSGKIRAVSSSRVVKLKLNDGSYEYHTLHPPTVGDPKYMSCINGTENTQIREATPSISGKCCKRRCLPLDPVTDADPVCPTTTTTTTTVATPAPPPPTGGVFACSGGCIPG